jgi:hypothetical protein
MLPGVAQRFAWPPINSSPIRSLPRLLAPPAIAFSVAHKDVSDCKSIPPAFGLCALLSSTPRVGTFRVAHAAASLIRCLSGPCPAGGEPPVGIWGVAQFAVAFSKASMIPKEPR